MVHELVQQYLVPTGTRVLLGNSRLRCVMIARPPVKRRDNQMRARVSFLAGLLISLVAAQERTLNLNVVSFTNFRDNSVLVVPRQVTTRQTLSDLEFSIQGNNSSQDVTIYFSLGYPYQDYFKPSLPVLIDQRTVSLRQGEASKLTFSLTETSLSPNGTALYGGYRIFLSVDCPMSQCTRDSTVLFRMITIEHEADSAIDANVAQADSSCQNKPAGMYCVGPPMPLLKLNRTLLSCPSGKMHTCQSGWYCDSTQAQGHVQCQLL